jgi:hypothetical protein
MEEHTRALVNTIRELCDLVELDIPYQHRGRCLNNKMAYAMELAESIEEYPIRKNLNLEPSSPCACETETI